MRSSPWQQWFGRFPRWPRCRACGRRPTFRPCLEVLESRQLLSTFVVTNTGDNGGRNPGPDQGSGTLRQAIIDSNAHPAASGQNEIDFRIGSSSGGPQVITLLSALPTVTAPVVLNGYTQPGATPNTLAQGDNAVLQVEINALFLPLGPAEDALTLGASANGSTVRGLAIVGAPGEDLVVQGTGDTIAGDFIGTTAAGTAPTNADGKPTTASSTGVDVQSDGNTVGGTSPADRNLISNIAGTGVLLSGNQDVAEGNLIGTDLAGTASLANTGTGVDVEGTKDTIGGTATGAGNLISGNSEGGVELDGDNNLVQGNRIGTDVTGTVALGNGTGSDGVGAFGNNEVIGGSAAGAGNLISGNDYDGIYVDGLGALIQGNQIGTDLTGTVALGNGHAGVEIEAANATIGGTAAGAGNLISGNATDGVYVNGLGALVEGNQIGTDVAGTQALGNQGLAGVQVDADGTDATIGGTATGAGNLISGNAQAGVELDGTGALVEGNQIGTDVTGTVALRNVNVGVDVEGTSNTVGGTATGAGNLISGNGEGGVELDGDNNLVQGNRIGTDVTGTAALGNGDGVDAFGNNEVIGGSAAGAGNLISGNNLDGVLVGGSGAQIQGNRIGTTADGSAALGNGTFGAEVEGSDATIGGTVAGAGNVISANQGRAGVGLFAPNDLVEGNLIGTDATGTVALGNSGSGVFAGNVNDTIGGTAAGAGNLISGNRGDGITLDNAVAPLVQGNLIGTDSSGRLPLGNQGNGIGLTDTNNATIGGTAAGAGNVIACNGGAGVSLTQSGGVSGAPLAGASSDAILSNSIFGNRHLGIDLGGTEQPLRNKAPIPGRPNNDQNYPVLASAVASSGSVTINGTFQSTPNTTYTLQFFANTVADPSGFGQGEVFLGSAQLTTGPADSTNTFTTTVTVSLPPGLTAVSATATDPDGNTSEFSADVPLLDTVIVLPIGPPPDPGPPGGGTPDPGPPTGGTSPSTTPQPTPPVPVTPVVVQPIVVPTVSTPTSNPVPNNLQNEAIALVRMMQPAVTGVTGSAMLFAMPAAPDGNAAKGPIGEVLTLFAPSGGGGEDLGLVLGGSVTVAEVQPNFNPGLGLATAPVIQPLALRAATASEGESGSLLLSQVEGKALRVGSSLAEADDSVELVEMLAGSPVHPPVPTTARPGPAPAVPAAAGPGEEQAATVPAVFVQEDGDKPGATEPAGPSGWLKAGLTVAAVVCTGGTVAVWWWIRRRSAPLAGVANEDACAGPPEAGQLEVPEHDATC